KLLVRRGNDFGIFISNTGTARFHVIPGAQQGRTTPVDLPLDTVVVTEGHYRLENGQPIILYNPR
ncbi:MAG: efflux RND transporter periplasmic adaptor subunit, partial [Gammaproteobacteria bacterium]|nr:efflux RND transporter periplasmic adaptor subunit [Gammaproteobacteria bacterium]